MKSAGITDMLSSVLVFLGVAVFWNDAVTTRCPVFNSEDDCSCRILADKGGDEFSTVTCYHLNSEVALERVLSATKGLSVFELELLDCSLRFLPHDAFRGTKIEVISIRNSSLHSLSDGSVAFEGLEDQLHLLEIMNCSYAGDWDWTQLSQLKRLIEIHVSDSNLMDIANGLASVQHLEIDGFVFQRDNIRALEDKVFSPFANLEHLSLDNNEIGELKRSMFPDPAKKLTILGLSYNKLSDLPPDLFLNMPKLKSLYLTGNPLQTINEVVFRPIWGQLRLFLFYDTRLSCDCRLTWLAKQDNSRKYMHAECEGPLGFKGRLLCNVTPDELWC